MQLVHIEKETSWEDHGFVRLKSALGELLGECSDFQHNRSLAKSWESTVTLVRQAQGEHPAKPPEKEKLPASPVGFKWSDLGVGGVSKRMPASLRAKPDLVGQGNSSMHKVSIPRQAQPRRNSSLVEPKIDQRQGKGAPRPPRRSSSMVHSRNQSRPRSPLIDNGQQVLRSKGRSQIQAGQQARNRVLELLGQNKLDN